MSLYTIRQELEAHLIQRIIDGAINEDNYEDAHHHAFNEDYYIIGYYNAENWLKQHDISAFEAIQKCIEYEKSAFGEVTKEYENAETTVNMLAYVMGLDVMPDCDSWGDLLEQLDITPTYFRKFDTGDVIALFPHNTYGDYVSSYQHVGQHGDASPELIDDLNKASRDEIRELSNELRNVGYTILEMG